MESDSDLAKHLKGAIEDLATPILDATPLLVIADHLEESGLPDVATLLRAFPQLDRQFWRMQVKRIPNADHENDDYGGLYQQFNVAMRAALQRGRWRQSQPYRKGLKDITDRLIKFSESLIGAIRKLGVEIVSDSSPPSMDDLENHVNRSLLLRHDGFGYAIDPEELAHAHAIYKDNTWLHKRMDKASQEMLIAILLGFVWARCHSMLVWIRWAYSVLEIPQEYPIQ